MTADDDKKARDRENKAADEFEAEIEVREEDEEAEERATQEDLNQGFNTGTHDSIRRGVNWPASYRVRPTEPSKPSSGTKQDDSKEKP
jgi:hypothetical protein